MINEGDFLALVEAAADLDDLQRNQFFAFRRASENRQFRRYLRAWAAAEGLPAIAKAGKAMEKWAVSSITGGLRLRDETNLPEWAVEIRRMLLAFSECNLRCEGTVAYRLIKPAVVYAHNKLQQRWEDESSSLLPAEVLHRFENQLESTLARTMQRCLDRHFQSFEIAFRSVMRGKGEIQQAELEREFIGEGAGSRLVEILQSFPALAKLWSNLILNWVQKIFELNLRLQKDRCAIGRIFFGGRNPGELVDVTLNISDPHRDGCEILILRFRNGRVVYKPRSGRQEIDWFSFVRWVNRQGFAPCLRNLRILNRHDYSWTEFVEHLPCAKKGDAHRYFRRAGGLVCAGYLLGAIDCHRDNLIASRDHPVLVDTETFFHPLAIHNSQDADRSVLRTGLLPISGAATCSGGEIGAFAGIGAHSHTPTFDGEPLLASDYTPDILRGFRAMWTIIGEPRTKSGSAFRRRLRQLSCRPWRRLYRSTKTYLQICDRSLAPNALRSGLGRSRSIAHDLIRPGVNTTIILQEIRALGHLDVPYFLESPSVHVPDGVSLSLAELLRSVRSALQG